MDRRNLSGTTPPPEIGKVGLMQEVMPRPDQQRMRNWRKFQQSILNAPVFGCNPRVQLGCPMRQKIDKGIPAILRLHKIAERKVLSTAEGFA